MNVTLCLCGAAVLLQCTLCHPHLLLSRSVSLFFFSFWYHSSFLSDACSAHNVLGGGGALRDSEQLWPLLFYHNWIEGQYSFDICLFFLKKLHIYSHRSNLKLHTQEQVKSMNIQHFKKRLRLTLPNIAQSPCKCSGWHLAVEDMFWRNILLEIARCLSLRLFSRKNKASLFPYMWRVQQSGKL